MTTKLSKVSKQKNGRYTRSVKDYEEWITHDTITIYLFVVGPGCLTYSCYHQHQSLPMWIDWPILTFRSYMENLEGKLSHFHQLLCILILVSFMVASKGLKVCIQSSFTLASRLNFQSLSSLIDRTMKWQVLIGWHLIVAYPCKYEPFCMYQPSNQEVHPKWNRY